MVVAAAVDMVVAAADMVVAAADMVVVAAVVDMVAASLEAADILVQVSDWAVAVRRPVRMAQVSPVAAPLWRVTAPCARVLHAANAMAGKHGAVEHATATHPGTDHHHHHHPFVREPQYGGISWPDYQLCGDRHPTRSIPGSIVSALPSPHPDPKAALKNLLRASESVGLATLLAAILAGGPLPLWAESAAPAGDDAIAKQFATAIEGSSALDAQSPDTLNTRLAYANFLTKLESGDCRAHLDEAQNQLDAAKASRGLAVVLPAGLARIAQVEYQLHSARASCGAGVRDQELHAALQSAQRAVELYRDEFDAVSMVTMQFNVSIAYHNLGDTTAAAAALRTTLDLDREYGFADDAEDNYRLLLSEDQAAGSGQIDALMKDFPERSATLSFGWSRATPRSRCKPMCRRSRVRTLRVSGRPEPRSVACATAWRAGWCLPTGCPAR